MSDWASSDGIVPLRLVDWLALTRPVDWLFSAYNLILAALWLSAAGRSAAALWLAGLHVGVAILPWPIRAASARGSAVASVIADLYPVVAVAFVWGELGKILPLLHPHPFDAAALRVESWALGAHWHARWMAADPSLWLSELMYAAYSSFYVLLVGTPLVMLLTGRRAQLRTLGARLLLTYVVCALFDFVWPVVGPTPVLPAHSDIAHGLFFQLTALVQHTGDSLGTSFPSTHVAAALTIACCAWAWSRPVLAAVITLDAVAITFSTVYTQNHYAIDAIAGALVAGTIQVAIVVWRRRGAVSSTMAEPSHHSAARPIARPSRLRPAEPPAPATPARPDR